LYCIVLYCIVLYCIVLYCIVLYCIVLYCIVWNLSFDCHDLISEAYIKPHAMMSMCAEDTPATARGMTCMSVLPFPS
jgi:hypothetical protein